MWMWANQPVVPRRWLLEVNGEWILHGCDFGCDSDVISDVKIYLQILHRCELDVIFASQFFSDVILVVILYHAWRESALRAPKISHELYIQYMTSITSRFCMDVTLDVNLQEPTLPTSQRPTPRSAASACAHVVAGKNDSTDLDWTADESHESSMSPLAVCWPRWAWARFI